jgi:transposase InsO family protein
MIAQAAHLAQSSGTGGAGPRTAWVPLDEAAALMGVSAGQLRRRCGTELEARGQARRIKVGSRVVWHVAASVSPRLVRAGVERTRNGASSVNQLLSVSTDDQRDKAQTKLAILLAFRAAKGRETGGGFSLDAFRARMEREHGWCPGRACLYKWHDLCPPSDDRAGCLAALLDTRGRPKGSADSCSDAAWEAFCKLYLTMQQWSVAKCHRAVQALADDEGWAWPSVDTVHALVKARLDPAMVCMAREGLDAYNRRFKAPLTQNPDAYAPGECWESDHVTLDFEIRVVGGPKGDGWVRTRPQLTTWFDRRTRRVMGWEISQQGNQDTIRRALLNALRDPSVSVPDRVVIDNGKDFMARSIGGITKQARRRASGDEQREIEQTATGILNLLGIEPHFAMPYNHDGKARIERWHGFVHEDFDREWPSYIGNKPGMVERRNMPDEAKEVMNLPTLQQVRERFDEWVTWYNHRAEHNIDDLRDPNTRERLSPAEFYDRHLPSKRRLADPDALHLLEPILSQPLKVGKRGIGFKVAGGGGGTTYYGEHAVFLERLVGSEARVYIGHDPEDISSVRVWDESFRFLGIAEMNGMYGGESVSRSDLKAGLAAQRDARKRVKQRIDLVALTAQPAELAARARRDRDVGETKARMREHDRTRDPNDLPNLRVVGTPLDGQADQVARAEQRKAAGCEYDPPPNMPSLIDCVASFHQPNAQAPTDPFASMGGFDTLAPRHTDAGSPGYSAHADPFRYEPPPPPPADDGLSEIRLTDLFL